MAELHLLDKPHIYFHDMALWLDSLSSPIELIELRGSFIAPLPQHEVSRLLAKLGDIPTLQTMQIEATSINVGYLARFLAGALQLRKLDMKNVTLTGSNHDFDRFYTALFKHPSLFEFRLINFDTANPVDFTQQIIRNLSTVPYLQSIELKLYNTHGRPRVRFSPICLVPLASCQCLTTIDLSGYELQHAHVNLINRVLEENRMYSSCQRNITDGEESIDRPPKVSCVRHSFAEAQQSIPYSLTGAAIGHTTAA